MNQRERKKRTAKTESAVKTVEKAETVKVEQTKKAVVKAAKAEKVYNTRFEKKLDELRWLYMELYGNGSMFAELCDQMHRFYEERTDALKQLDSKREADPDWYKKNDMLGMMFYIDNFAGNMKGVESKIDYINRIDWIIGWVAPLVAGISTTAIFLRYLYQVFTGKEQCQLYSSDAVSGYSERSF